MRKRPAVFSDSVTSIGRVSPDYGIIELVRSTNCFSLLWCDDDVPKIDRNRRVGGQTLRAPEADDSFLQGMMLPQKPVSYGSVRELLENMAEVIVCYTAFFENTAKLIALFSLSSWVVEALPAHPRLHLLGAWSMAGCQLVQLFNSLCRHPINLLNLDRQTLKALPGGFSPTIFVLQPSPLTRQLLTSQIPAGIVYGRSRLAQLESAIVLHSTPPVKFHTRRQQLRSRLPSAGRLRRSFPNQRPLSWRTNSKIGCWLIESMP